MDNGLARSIGVSNFSGEQIDRITNIARIKPASVQVELHVQFQQKPLRDRCHKHGISMCAYAPLGSPGRAELYKKTGYFIIHLGKRQEMHSTDTNAINVCLFYSS